VVRAGRRRPRGHPRLHCSDSPHYAQRFVEKLIAAAEPLETFPQLGRIVPEGDGRHRELLFRSYRIIYRVKGEEILIVTVVHGSRNLADADEKPWERI
jgi:toxin ParE1/3/4